METGYDIFFWVARMILMTTYVTGQVPFETVYLHGLVLDRDGDKMSKSKPETSIDPLEEIGKNGADALRMALVIGNAPGQDFRLSEERILACKHLVNKLWNAAKLVERTLGEEPVPEIDRHGDHPVNAGWWRGADGWPPRPARWRPMPSATWWSDPLRLDRVLRFPQAIKRRTSPPCPRRGPSSSAASRPTSASCSPTCPS
jgi:hypothetical protein